jgi:hypothetical protein
MMRLRTPKGFPVIGQSLDLPDGWQWAENGTHCYLIEGGIVTSCRCAQARDIKTGRLNYVRPTRESFAERFGEKAATQLYGEAAAPSVAING